MMNRHQNRLLHGSAVDMDIKSLGTNGNIFLVAILIGVSVYTRHPSEIYAIEPFMMMQVAYDVRPSTSIRYKRS
jgi:hypothetical protein